VVILNVVSMLIIFKGDGKGKTSAALGVALRAVGWGKKVAIIQFIKKKKCGEHKAVAKYLKNIKIILAGKGFVGIRGDKLSMQKHRLAAENGFKKAQSAVQSKKYQLIILDEILGAISGRLLTIDEVLDLLQNIPAKTDIILTGRGNFPKIEKIADVVTECHKIKHSFAKGQKAKKGIDY